MINDEKIDVSLIDYKEKISPFFGRIIDTINNYLLRNKSAVSDFNLIKDIVDRNVDKEDDDISSNLPIPLYLGLIGTMLGIIIGLLGMPALSGDVSDKTMQGVDVLLSGVKIAMIASVLGLIFTTINSFFYYSVRKKTEHQKNEFFTFIQTRLLPILSKNTASSIQTLQTNLLKFNDGFSSNMAQFNSVISEVRSSFESQLQVVEELKRIDVSNMAKYNINVMKQIEKSFGKLKELSEYLDNVNGFLNNTRELNLAVSQQLHKVGEISQVVEHFDKNASHIAEGSTYLQSHFKDVDNREQAINNRLADFDGNVDKMMDNLKNSFEERLQKFNESDVKINSGFEDLFKEINSGFKELFEDLREKSEQVFDDESQNISAINGNVVSLKESVNQLSSITSEVSSLKSTVSQQNKTITDLLSALSNKPLAFKMPKFLTASIIILTGVVFITCILIIIKTFI